MVRTLSWIINKILPSDTRVSSSGNALGRNYMHRAFTLASFYSILFVLNSYSAFIKNDI